MIHRVSENLRQIRLSIDSIIQQKSLTQPITLIAVSKLQSNDLIQAAYEAGHRDFGENYIDELLTKSQSLPRDIRWHMIGHIQSNKVNKLLSIENLSAVHTVDSLALALKLNKRLQELNRNLEFFMQINTSGESSKSGISPTSLQEILLEVLHKCQNLKFKGLMTIGEKGNFEDFEVLLTCRRELCQRLAVSEASIELSMGMSGDYLEALAQGSNFIRIGTSIFGSRPT